MGILDGMSREVFALTGGATPPPLVPEASVNKGYKEKRKISDKKVSWYTQHSCAVYHWGSSASSVRSSRLTRGVGQPLQGVEADRAPGEAGGRP
jgi:hypothetical protein